MGSFTSNGLYKPDAEEGGTAGLLNDNWDIIDDFITTGGGAVPSGDDVFTVYNVTDAAYGAVGNGTTDDRAAIQSAIDTAAGAGGGIVYLPPATYGVKGTLHLKSSVSLQGAGRNASIIKAIATFVGTKLVDSNSGSGVTQVDIGNIYFNGNSLVATAVEFTSPSGSPGHNVMSYCRLTGTTTNLLTLGGSGGFECHAIRNSFSSAGGAIITTGTDNMIAFNNFGSITAIGIDLQSGGNQVISNHIVTAGASGVCLNVSGGQVNVIQNNYFDASATQSAPMLTVTAGAGVNALGGQILGNVFYAQFLSADNTYPAMQFTQSSTGTIDNWVIDGNQGRAKTSFRFSSIVASSGTVTNCQMMNNRMLYCVSIGTLGASALGLNTIYDGTSYKIGRRRQGRIDLTYSSPITPDAMFGDRLVITATNTTAFTINAPTNPLDGMPLELTIKNSSGGTLGTITWNSAFLFVNTFTPPTNGNERTLMFKYSNVDSKWHEIGGGGGGGSVTISTATPVDVVLGTAAGVAGSTGQVSDAGHTHGVDVFSVVAGLSIPSPVAGTYFCGVVETAMTLVSIGAYRDGGTGLTVNFAKGSKASPSKGKAADVSATSSDTVVTGNADQNQTYSPGDQMYAIIATVSGSPSLAAVQANFTVP